MARGPPDWQKIAIRKRRKPSADELRAGRGDPLAQAALERLRDAGRTDGARFTLKFDDSADPEPSTD